MEEINLPIGCMGMQPRLASKPAVAGIDIRPDSWDLIIADMRKPKVGDQEINRTMLRPVFVGKVFNENQALFVMRKYGVTHGVADCRPEATLAKRLQEACFQVGIELWRSEYNTMPSSVKITRNENEKLLKLERTMTLDVVHGAFQTALGIQLPQNYKELNGGAFASELRNPSKVMTMWHQRPHWDWRNNGDDHAFHALNLLYVAYLEISPYALFGLGDKTIFVRGTINGSTSVVEEGTPTKPGEAPAFDANAYLRQIMMGDKDSTVWVA